MTPKARLLSAIKGQPLDRIPWSPFLAYWWEAQPEAFQAEGQLPFLEDIGADPLLRGSHYLFGLSRENCDIRESTSGNKRIKTYDTPVGSLTETHTYVEAANTWFLTEHPVKTKEDFKVLIYIMEHSRVTPKDALQFEKDRVKYGERALLLPLMNCFCKTAFQNLLEHYVGTEELTYALADYPEVVEECLAVMTELSVQSAKMAVGTSADGFIFWEDSSTTNISPAWFLRYVAPEINAWGSLVHDAGKLLVHHACGHLKDLLPLMGQTRIDMVESISPPPTGNIELWDAAKLLPPHIGLIGGIEPTVFLNSDLDALESYTKKLLSAMNGRRFILANSDSCPPGVSIEKFRLISGLV